MIRANGSLSLVHSASTVTGFEWTRGKNLFYGYYGGVYIGKNLALDANGKTLIGYGSDRERRAEPGHPGNHLRHQYDADEELQVGRPESDVPILVSPTESVACDGYGAHQRKRCRWAFVNLRYTLPGSAPTMGK